MNIKSISVQRAVLFFGLLVLVLVGYKVYHANREPDIKKASAIRVTVVSPVEKIVKNKLTATGVTLPKEDVIVTTELSGLRVKKIFGDIGQIVKAGDVLAELDNETITNVLTQVESEHERIQDEFIRTEKLKGSGVVSKAQIQQKQTALEIAKLKLDEAKLNLKRTQVIAPVDGVIYERKADIGELAAANQPLFRMSQDGWIEFEAKIAESDFKKVKPEMSAFINLTGYEKPLLGKIRFVTPAIDPSSRLIIVRISFEEKPSLPVGLFGNVEIHLGELKGLSIPASALQQDSQGLFVWKLGPENKVHRLPVEPFYQDPENLLIQNLSEDMQIIAKAGAFVNEGEVVIPVKGS